MDITPPAALDLLDSLEIQAWDPACCTRGPWTLYAASVRGREGQALRIALPDSGRILEMRARTKRIDDPAHPRKPEPSCWSDVFRLDTRPEWRAALEAARTLPPLYELVREQMQAIERERRMLVR